MDHLPRPRNPTLELDEVPYICHGEYDGLGFVDYPVRKGWATEGGDISQALSTKPEREISAFVQQYLWFGLGHEILGPDFSRCNFTRKTANHVEILCTHSLESLGRQWVEAQQRTSPSVRQSKADHYTICISRALDTLATLDLPEHRGSLDGRIGRSIIALAEALYAVILWQFRKEVDLCPQGVIRHLTLSYVESYYQKLLEESKWCKSDWSSLRQSPSSIARLHYLANLTPPKPDTDHLGCDELTCRAYQINSQAYQTKHASRGCKCKQLIVNQEELDKILEKGDVPVLFLDTIEENGSKTSRLRVERWTPDLSYVAISHVWADGMGNPSANALPECQLKKLKRLVNGLPDERLQGDYNEYEKSPGRRASKPRQQQQKSSYWFFRFLTSMRPVSKPKEARPLRPQDIGSAAKFVKDFLVSLSRNHDLHHTLARFLLSGLDNSNFDPTRFLIAHEEPGRDFPLFENLMQILPHFSNWLDKVTETNDELLNNKSLEVELGNLISSIYKIEQRRTRERDQGSADAGAESDTEGANATRVMNGSQKERGFWIDTICCPVRPERMKKLAFAKMKETYEHAQHVLVIDSYLESVDSSRTSDTELLMRVLVSGWMKRLWTLQEAVLSQTLWFQFADAPVELIPLKWRWDGHNDRLDTVLDDDIALLHQSLVSLKNTGGLVEQAEIAKLSSALRHRSTSVASDEAICVGNLLQLDFSGIYKRNRQPTMEDVWKGISTVSATVIFSYSPRLQTPGLRWAPATFLRGDIAAGSDDHDNDNNNKGTIVPGGLEVSFPGLILQASIPEASNHFHIFVDNSSEDMYGQEDRQWYCCTVPPESTLIDERSKNLDQGSPVLILSKLPKPQEGLRHEHNTSHGSKFSRTRALYAMLDRDRYVRDFVARVQPRLVVELAMLKDAEKLVPTAREIVHAVNERLAESNPLDTATRIALRNQYISEEVDGNATDSSNDVYSTHLSMLVQEYYDLWKEDDFGIEALKMGDGENGEDDSAVDWTVT